MPEIHIIDLNSTKVKQIRCPFSRTTRRIGGMCFQQVAAVDNKETSQLRGQLLLQICRHYLIFYFLDHLLQIRLFHFFGYNQKYSGTR
jgi:hypothetical protein